MVRTRSFGHTGPGQAPRFVIPSMARSRSRRSSAGGAEPVLEVGNLEVTRDLTDVRDVVRAYVALLERGRAGAAYNVCRGEGVRLADVVARLGGAGARADPDRGRSRAPAARRRALPGRRSRPRSSATPDGRPAIPLEQTLDDVLEEWRARALNLPMKEKGTHRQRRES